jgi:hypothetical protein
MQMFSALASDNFTFPRFFKCHSESFGATYNGY